MPTPKETARKARTLAAETSFTKHGSKDIVKADAKLNKKTLTPAQEKKAVDAMQTRRMNDRKRTASRAEFIARREDPNNKKAGMKKAVREGNMKFEKIKKAAAKPTATPKAKPMTEAQKQAKALDALEKKRAAVAKKTGKRPNYYTN